MAGITVSNITMTSAYVSVTGSSHSIPRAYEFYVEQNSTGQHLFSASGTWQASSADSYTRQLTGLTQSTSYTAVYNYGPIWVSGTQYEVGNVVKYGLSWYSCKTRNKDTTFTSSHWNTSSAPYTYSSSFTTLGPNKFRLRCFSNGGVGPIPQYPNQYLWPSDKPVEDGTTSVLIDITGAKPTRDHYDFNGWTTSQGNIAATTENAIVNTSTHYDRLESGVYIRELTARWTAHTYTMRYDPYGGSGSIPDGTKTYGVDYIVKTASGFNPPAAGQVFDHWHYVSSDGHEGDLNPYDAYTRNYSATFYAIWVQETYKVSYDPNGGSTTPSSEWHAAGDYVTLAAGIAKANSSEQQDGYYTVTYNGNGGTIVRNYDYAYRYYHYEYRFRAWAYGSNEYPERYERFPMPPNDVEFVAQFNSTTHYRTDGVTLPSGSKSGYALDHWETSAGVNVGAPGATYTPPNQSLILYAIWEPVYHFDWDAPKVSGQPFNVTANEWVRYGNTMRQRFIDEGRTPPTFRSITAGVTVFSKEYWNDFVDAVNTIHPGSMTHVSSGDIVYASGFSTLKNKLNT